MATALTSAGARAARAAPPRRERRTQSFQFRSCAWVSPASWCLHWLGPDTLFIKLSPSHAGQTSCLSCPLGPCGGAFRLPAWSLAPGVPCYPALLLFAGFLPASPSVSPVTRRTCTCHFYISILRERSRPDTMNCRVPTAGPCCMGLAWQSSVLCGSLEHRLFPRTSTSDRPSVATMEQDKASLEFCLYTDTPEHFPNYRNHQRPPHRHSKWWLLLTSHSLASLDTSL